LPRVDARTRASRRYLELVQTFEAELGYQLTEADRVMIKQAATLSLQGEHLEAAIVSGSLVDSDDLIRVSSEARRIIATLRSKAKDKAPSHDPMAAHIAAKYGRPVDNEEVAADQ
jgi:hypothetical protein